MSLDRNTLQLGQEAALPRDLLAEISAATVEAVNRENAPLRRAAWERFCAACLIFALGILIGAILAAGAWRLGLGSVGP